MEQGEIIVELLIQLRDFRKYYSCNDLSTTNILDQLGAYLHDSHLSQFSIYCYQEKLRIEKLYLRPYYPHLALTLYSVGKVYVENEQFSEAKEFFIEADSLLKENNITQFYCHYLICFTYYLSSIQQK